MYIITQLAVYTTYILPSRGLYNPYHPLQEPEKSIDYARVLDVLEVACYLEDHPRTCKWLVTMVIVSPLSRIVGPVPNGLFMACK